MTRRRTVGMRRAMMIVKVSDALIADGGVDHVTPPPEPWFVRGVRGGLYVATGTVKRIGPDWMDDDFMCGVQSVGFRSEGVRYVRPGSRLAREAEKHTM